jgi:hypothetical protein
MFATNPTMTSRLLRSTAAFCLVASSFWIGCSHRNDPPPTTPENLLPPPSGQGFQFKTGDFAVPAGTEEQDCYFFRVKDLAQAGGLDPSKPVNLHRVQVVQLSGTHHMNVFRVRTIAGLDPKNGAIQKASNGTGECFKSSNWADWPLVANTQQGGQIDWTFPDGVVNELNDAANPDEWLMLQTHYVNATTQSTPDALGSVTVNFFTLPAEQVTAKMGTVFATKQSIRVCEKNPTPTFSGTCQFNSTQPVHVIGANGHFHSRGKEFDIFAWDGKSTSTPDVSQRFYQSLRWDDPPMAHSPTLDLQVPAQGGIWYTCAYEWVPPTDAVGCAGVNAYDQTKYMTPADQLDCCYTFGPIVEKSEHCNAFVYYYPKQDDVNCN